MSGLTVHTGDTLTTAARWISWEASERRRRAIEACRDRDISVLWELTRVFLTLHGKAGARVSPRTLEAYEGGVKVLLAGWQGVSLIHASRDDAAMLVRQFEEAGLSTSTIQVRLAGIRALYRALRWAGATDGDPFRDVRPAPDKTAAWDRRTPYSQSDIDRLLSVAIGEDALLVLLGSKAGLRAMEIMNLQWQHVDFDRHRLWTMGKGRKEAYVGMTGTLERALLDQRRDNGYVISAYRTTHQARNRMRVLCERAGVSPLALHSLRHFCGTDLQKRLGDVHKVARHLRHSSISTTETYLHWAEEDLSDTLRGM